VKSAALSLKCLLQGAGPGIESHSGCVDSFVTVALDFAFATAKNP
jgi:hypothetical protein